MTYRHAQPQTVEPDPTLRPLPALVSVVIPVHDGGPLLAEAVQSVATQSLPPGVELEVIVVDDGSTDGAPAALAAQGHQVVVLNQDRAGPSAARNLGLAAANGDLVAFLDADDRWVPDKLAIQISHLRSGACDVSLGRQQVSLLHGVEHPDWVDQMPQWMPHSWRERVSGQIPLSTMVLARELFERIGPFDEGLRHGEDVDWILRATESGLCVDVVGQVVLERRIHHGNLSHDTAAMTRGMLSVLARRAARNRTEAAHDEPGLVSVSVVVPLRHHADLLGEALASVAAQGDLVGEVIVIDDGSTEVDSHTIGQICRQAGVRRARQSPRGAAAARNLGARLATGSHLLFLDADDRLASGAVAALVETMDAADVVPGEVAALGFTEEFGDGVVAGHRHRAPLTAQVRLLGAMLVPRRRFRAIGGFDEDLGRAEGLDLVHRAVASGMTVLETDALVLHRRLHTANGGVGAGTADYLTVARRAIERNRRTPG